MGKTGCIVTTEKSEAHKMKTAVTVRSALRFYTLLASVRLSLNVVLKSPDYIWPALHFN